MQLKTGHRVIVQKMKSSNAFESEVPVGTIFAGTLTGCPYKVGSKVRLEELNEKSITRSITVIDEFPDRVRIRTASSEYEVTVIGRDDARFSELLAATKSFFRK